MSRHNPKHSSNNAAVRIRVLWGESLLDVIELSPPRPFFIGDAALSKLPVDLTVPEFGTADATRVPLVTVDDGEPRVRVPFGASAVRRALAGAKIECGSDSLVENDAALDTKSAIDVRLGELVLSVTLGEREASCPRALGGGDHARPFAFFGLSALATGVVVASMAFFMPPMGLTDDEGTDRDRIYMIQQYLDAAAEREHETEPTPSGEASGGEQNAAPDPAARGAAGKMGKPEVTAQNRRASGTAAGAETRPATSRAEDRALAENFGMIGLLSSGALGPTPAPWDDSGVGNLAVAGGLFGTEIGESGGVNGLSLSGLEEGGGGHADQIALASIGTCRGEACKHGLEGYGVGGDRRGPGYVPKALSLRMGKTVVDGGSLPPEIIQRVVRQSFGRFRNCYEDGLRGNPNLEGRVTARFVIARDGSVMTVQSGGSDLPDAHVVACVLRAYGSLTFPAPKDGVVRVSYPLMFSPSA
jgi:hypothetical protein